MFLPSLSDILSMLDPFERKITQTLAVFKRPASPRALAYMLAPFEPGFSSLEAERRLQDLSNRYPQLFQVKFGHYFFQPSDQLALLAEVPQGSPDDPGEGTQMPFTRYALLRRAVIYYQTQRTAQHSWSNIDDLQPQLSEFEVLCELQDYDSAAELLQDISFEYLMRWGHYRQVIALRERLIGHLKNPTLEQVNLGELGSAYAVIGELEKAIHYQEQALAFAREMGDKRNEGVWLTNLGNRHINLGQIDRALEYFQLALVNAQDQDDLRSEGVILSALGTCCTQMGQFERAREYYEEARVFAKAHDDMAAEGMILSNLGNIYVALGDPALGIRIHDQGLEIARELENMLEVSRRLGNLAEALVADGLYKEAIQHLEEGLRLDEETGYHRGKNYKGCTLTLAYLSQGDLDAAYAAIQTAIRFDAPANNHNAVLLMGIVTLKQKQLRPAKDAFLSAVNSAGSLLKRNAYSFDALNAASLARCGLAILDDDSSHLTAAAESVVRSRNFCRAPGVLRHMERLFEFINAEDSARILATIRPLIVER